MAAELSRVSAVDLGDLVERTVSICERTLTEAQVDKGDLDDVILVGGMTRMPLVQQLVRPAHCEGMSVKGPSKAAASGEPKATRGGMRLGRGLLRFGRWCLH